jgi:hypothetical protein
MNKKALATLFAAMSFAASSASAQLITFDDLIDNGNDNGTAINNGYAGLNWDSFNVLNTTSFLASGFVNGTVSPHNVAYNDQANPAAISSMTKTGFNLVDANFTGAWNDGLQIEVLAYSNTGIQTKSFTVDSTSATKIDFSWDNITYVQFSSYGGKNAGYGPTGYQFAMDNLTVTAVPEPEQWVMLMVGIPLVGWQIRRRQKACKCAIAASLPSGTLGKG